MGIDSNVILSGSKGNKSFLQSFRPTNITGGEDPLGVIAYTEPRKDIEPMVMPVVNPTQGIALNVDAAFGGTPEGVHNGGDSVLWTASALSGTWDFASTTQANSGSASIDATATKVDDEALFEDGTSISASSYVALTGFIYITSFTTNQGFELRALLNSVDQGNPVNIKEFVDTTILNSWMKFVIPMADLGLTTETIDELILKTTNTMGGSAPDYFIDDMQWEQTGGFTYVAGPPQSEWWYLIGQRISIANTALTPDANGNTFIDYTKLLGITAPTNGLLVTIQSRGVSVTGQSVKTLGDVLQIPRVTLTVNEPSSSGTIIGINTDQTEPFRLQGELGDNFTLFISDDLSAFDIFNWWIFGWKEKRS